MKTINLMILSALLLSASGCFRTRVLLNPAQGGTYPSPRYHDRHVHFAVKGLANFSEVTELDKACAGDEVAYIKQEHSFIDALISGFTSALYTPITQDVVCARGSSSKP